MELVRFPARGARPAEGATKKSPPFCSELIGPVRNAILRARHRLLSRQRSDGRWLGWQTGAVSLLSQLVFLMAYSEREDSELAEQCATTIGYEQRPDGAWAVTSDGSADISASVQAYFALKLMGHDPADERMRQAREQIRELGGADAADSETRYFLALFAQLGYEYCEPVSPEGILLHRNGSSRQVPMSIVWSHRPVREVAMEMGVRELFVDRPCGWPTTFESEHGKRFRRRAKTVLNSMNQFVEQRGWSPLRRRALNRAESQLLSNIEPNRISELCFQDLVWHAIALRTMGYEADSLELSICEERLHSLVDVDQDAGLISPRVEPGILADSAIAVRSLVTSGMSTAHPTIDDGIDRLSEQVTAGAPSSASSLCDTIESLLRCTTTQSERDTILPPDIDVHWDWQYADAAAEPIANDRSEELSQLAESCVEQLLTTQNADGGWCNGTESKLRKRSSKPDSTGAAMESLAKSKGVRVQAVVQAGRRFLTSQQRGDGCWAQVDGTQQVLCTSTAVRGLLGAGISPDDDCIAAALNWLVVQQQPSGAWQGSAIQTAWAITGLLAAGRADHPAVRRGVEFLLDSQDEDGGWIDRRPVLRSPDSNHWICNDLHSAAWPLLALSQFAVATNSAESSDAGQVSLRLVAAGSEN